MRILHVIPGVARVYGGPSHAIASMTGALAKLGATVDVATTNAAGDVDLDVPLGVPIEADGVRTFYFSRLGRASWKFSWPLTRWLLDHVRDYDVVHAHALFSYTTLAACTSSRRADRPYVIRPLGTLDAWSLREKRWKKAPYFELFERRNLAHASAIHATSDAEAREVARLGFGDKTVVIPLGLTLPAPNSDARRARFERGVPTAEAPLELLFLSRIHPKKGLMVLLDAMSELGARGFPARLTIAGNAEGGYERVVDERVRALGLAATVVRRGYVEGEEKRALYAASDLFVLPSYQENFGIAVAEALANGLPAIVSDAVALCTEVGAAGAGAVVPIDRPHAIVEAVEALAVPEARRRASDNARALAEGTFAAEPRARALMQLYETITRER